MANISTEEYFSNIVSKLGVTNVWTAAGYILPDGNLLDLSNVERYPDPTVRYYTHKDLQKFFNINNNKVLLKGGIRIGYGDTNDIPYAQIVLKECNPTNEQWNKLGELLNTEPGILDLEVDMEPNKPTTSFYKRYSADQHTLADIKRDIKEYMQGSKENLGKFSERMGIRDFIQ